MEERSCKDTVNVFRLFLVKCAEAELEIRESIEDNLKTLFMCRACATAYSDRSNLLVSLGF